MSHQTHARRDGVPDAGAPADEREVKFLADAGTMERVLASPAFGGGAPVEWRTLRTVYFDTDDGALARARVALRVRQSDDGFVMGLKRRASGGGAFAREEREVAVPACAPDLSRFDERVAREVDAIVGGRPLAPRFGSDIRRAVRTVTREGATIEIAFDDGALFAGARRAPAAEIELELKSGPPAALFDLGLGLLDAFPVRLGMRSKAERAHELMAPAPPAPVHAAEPSLDPGTPLDSAIATIARACLVHLLANLPALEGGDRTEAVHQMRVATRRLRSAIDLFREAFPTTELDALRGEARRIGTTLGAARDWDVFVARLGHGALARFADEPGFASLVAGARAKADEAHAAVARLVEGQAVARFALRVERLVASRGWRDSADAGALAALDAPVEAFSARALETLDRRMRRRGRRFRSLGRVARHRLRIAVKHLRYATEFFGVLIDAKEAKRFAGRASALQDALGVVNDAVVALRLVEDLGALRNPTDARAAGLVAGWCARESEGDGVALDKAWRRFVTAAATWRKRFRHGASG